MLDKAYKQRPTFENDEEIMEAFTEYARIVKEINQHRDKLEKLRKEITLRK